MKVSDELRVHMYVCQPAECTPFLATIAIAPMNISGFFKEDKVHVRIGADQQTGERGVSDSVRMRQQENA